MVTFQQFQSAQPMRAVATAGLYTPQAAGSTTTTPRVEPQQRPSPKYAQAQRQLHQLSFGELRGYLQQANQQVGALNTDRFERVLTRAETQYQGQPALSPYTYVMQQLAGQDTPQAAQLIPRFLGRVRNGIYHQLSQQEAQRLNVVG